MKTSTRKRRLINYAILVALSAVACMPIFHAGFYRGHDWVFEFVRIAEYYHSLSEGVFPVRWGANLWGGYGSPIFIFFPPVFLFICGVLSALGMTFVASAKLAVFFLTAMGGVGMYWFSREFFDDTGGMLSACLYVLAPYHFVDVFVRNAFSEFAALCIVPFVFYGLTAILKGSGPMHRARFVLALSLSLFALSHNLSAVMYAPLLGLYGLTILLVNGRWERLWQLAAPVAVSLLLVSFYAVPIVFEKEYVQLWRLTVGKFDTLKNLVPLASLVSGASWYSVTAFSPALLVAIAAVLIVRRDKIEKPVFAVLVVFAVILAGYTFLMTPHSRAVWENAAFLSIFQFPWRLLSPATFLLCVLSGSVVFLAGERDTLRVALAAVVVVAGCVFLLSQYPAGGGAYVDIRDGSLSAERIREDKLPATVMQEYSTIWSKRGMSPANARKLQLPGGERLIEAYEEKPDRLKYRLTLPESSSVTAHVYYFPGWAAHSDGEELPVSVTSTGLISFSLPPGEHVVDLEFKDTPARKIAGLVSLAGLAGFFWLLISAVRAQKDTRPSG